MTLLQLLKEIRDMGPAGDRLRKVKCGEIEIELDPPADGRPKQVFIPEGHGIAKSEEEMRLLEELERRHGYYGAAQGAVPSDYVEQS